MGQDLLSTPSSGCAEASKNHQMTTFASSDNYPSEQELIDMAVAGDATGFNGIVSRYSNRIYRFILKNLGNTAVAEDLTQETFVEAYRKLPAFKGEAKFSTWLFGIALNRVRNYVNRSPDRRRDCIPAEILCHADTADGNPIGFLEKKRTLLALQRAIYTLPTKLRESLILVVLEELSYEEAAQIMGIATGTVKSRVHRARNMLRESMKLGFDC